MIEEDPDSGEMTPAFGGAGTPRGYLPLRAMSVRGKIMGLLHSTKVEQSFFNSYDTPFGRDLLPLLDPSGDAPSLLDRIAQMREHLASELGFLCPGVRFRDTEDEPSHGYDIEQSIETLLRRFLPIPSEMGREILQTLSEQVETLSQQGIQPILLSSAPARPILRKLTEPSLPNLVVLSRSEIPPEVVVNCVNCRFVKPMF